MSIKIVASIFVLFASRDAFKVQCDILLEIRISDSGKYADKNKFSDSDRCELISLPLRILRPLQSQRPKLYRCQNRADRGTKENVRKAGQPRQPNRVLDVLLVQPVRFLRQTRRRLKRWLIQPARTSTSIFCMTAKHTNQNKSTVFGRSTPRLATHEISSERSRLSSGSTSQKPNWRFLLLERAPMIRNRVGGQVVPVLSSSTQPWR